jgi:hypothetical protein
METNILVGTIKQWNKEKERYELSESFDFDGKVKIKFGGITITTDPRPPLADPTDKTQSIILRKEKGKRAPILLHMFEQRDYKKEPNEYIVGKTIMVTNDFFYFSNLSDLVYLQIYRGDPKEHPEMIEIVPAQHIGENQSGSLL